MEIRGVNSILRKRELRGMMGSMNSVLCPHCGKDVEINQALKHQIEEDILREERSKHKAELEKIKSEIEKDTAKKVQEEVALKLKNSANELEETKKKSEKLQQDLLDQMKALRELKDEQQQKEIAMQKQLIQEREKMQEEMTKALQEKANLETAELKKQLEDTKKALEDAQRKAAQKSQQLQGEVLELNLESHLREDFPYDEILPVPKGIDGADICQKVRNKHGQTAGIILWETKRTKAWSNSWLPKLRDDKRRMDASIAILVSDVLPETVNTFGLHENVWVTSYQYALPLVNVLRMGLFELAVAKSTAAHKDERLEALFSYLSKDGFRNRFEAQVESLLMLKNDLEAEQRSTIRMWKKREMQIKRLMGSVATMYGELQGIMGPALPSIPSLESGTEIEESEQQNLLE